ncbi:MAG: PEP-CTERM sorting domain-containing protein [Planctomycetota bacterium]
MITRFSVVGSLACVFALIAGSAAGASINHGDYSGDTVDFLGVAEGTLDPNAQFGAPTLSDDALAFTPSLFLAESKLGVPVLQFVDVQLEMQIKAKPGYYLDEINYSEGGDFTLDSGLVAPGQAQVQVAVPARLKILEVDGVGIAPVSVNLQATFSPNANGVFSLPSDQGVGKFWDGVVSFDLAALGYSKATLVSLTIDDSLLAKSDLNGIAFIRKKSADVTVSTVPIPEPGTLCLLGVAGLMGLGVFLRKKS